MKNPRKPRTAWVGFNELDSAYTVGDSSVESRHAADGDYAGARFTHVRMIEAAPVRKLVEAVKALARCDYPWLADGSNGCGECAGCRLRAAMIGMGEKL